MVVLLSIGPNEAAALPSPAVNSRGRIRHPSWRIAANLSRPRHHVNGWLTWSTCPQVGLLLELHRRCAGPSGIDASDPQPTFCAATRSPRWSPGCSFTGASYLLPRHL